MGKEKKLKERGTRVSQSSEYHIHHLDAGRVRPYTSSTNLMRLGLIIFYSKMSLTIFLMSNLKKGKKEQTNLSVFTQPRIFTSKRRKLVQKQENVELLGSSNRIKVTNACVGDQSLLQQCSIVDQGTLSKSVDRLRNGQISQNTGA